MRPKAKARDIPSDSTKRPTLRRTAAFGAGGRRPIESRFAPLSPSRADNDDQADGLAAGPHRRGAPPLPPPTNLTLLIRAAGLVVVVAAVLLVLRPVAKIVRTAPPAATPERIRVISSTGDSMAAATPVRPKRQARLPRAADAPPRPAAPLPTAPAPAAQTMPAADDALAFAPKPAMPTNPALIATVHAVPVFAPESASRSTFAPAPRALPAPRPTGAVQTGNTDALVREARRLIAKGELTQGRDLLKRAAAAGNSHAATILAKTYDPNVQKIWHVKGATVDPAEARRWYEKAKELASPTTKAALEGMK